MASSSDEEIFEVEKVLAKRRRPNVEYLVRWKGYTSKHDSWEPLSNLSGCRELVQEFNTAHNQELREKTRETRKDANVTLSQLFVGSKDKQAVKRLADNTFTAKVSVDLRSSSQTEKQTEGVRSVATVVAAKVKNSADTETRKTFVAKDHGYFQNTLFQTKTTSPSASETAKVKIDAPKVAILPKSCAPQKVFKVSDRLRLVGVADPKYCPTPKEHDYPRTKQGRNLFKPVEYLEMSADERKQVVQRKSVLRRAGVHTERLLYLQWRDDMVEIVFANKRKGNSLTPKFLEELMNALDAVVASKCALAVLTSLGEKFCSGFDVEMLIGIISSPKLYGTTPRKLSELLRNFINKLIDFPKPLVAVVQGPAVGLGCSILALLDTVYCSERAMFWTPYTAMGVTPDGCSSYLFPQMLGMNMANKMLMNGMRITAQEAKEKGLVTEVFRHDTFKQNALALVTEIAHHNSEALQLTKALIRNPCQMQLKQSNCLECSQLAEIWSTQGVVENLQSFLKKNG